MLAQPHDKNSRVIGAGGSGQWATRERNEHQSHIKHYTETNKEIKVEEQDRLVPLDYYGCFCYSFCDYYLFKGGSVIDIFYILTR